MSDAIGLDYVHGKRGQWWHILAAVKDTDNNLYGVQCTVFHFKGHAPFAHCALTNVAKGTFERTEKTGYAPPFGVVHRNFCVKFTLPSWAEVILVLNPGEQAIQEYQSETSKHYGIPRMEAKGRINGQLVQGVGCYDREVFDRLLKPGETGWNWCVLWFDDGKTEMGYVYQGEQRRQVIGITFDGYYLKRQVEGEWPKSKRMVAYKEELYSIVKFEPQQEKLGELKPIGLGFLEEVGYDGTPDL